MMAASATYDLNQPASKYVISPPIPFNQEVNQNMAKQVVKNIFGFFPNPKEALEKIRDKVSDKISEASKEYLDPSPYDSVLNVPCRLLEGTEEQRIGDQAMGKKAILMVNVASKWGLTDVNYKQMVQLYKELESEGLQIFLFPCNQFGNQEPGSPSEIRDFVNKYDVEFPVFEKIDVNGTNTHPVYKNLRQNSKLNKGENKCGQITWNFGKFLVD